MLGHQTTIGCARCVQVKFPRLPNQDARKPLSIVELCSSDRFTVVRLNRPHRDVNRQSDPIGLAMTKARLEVGQGEGHCDRLPRTTAHSAASARISRDPDEALHGSPSVAGGLEISRTWHVTRVGQHQRASGRGLPTQDVRLLASLPQHVADRPEGHGRLVPDHVVAGGDHHLLGAGTEH